MAIVNSALVIARDEDGKYVYLYQGTEVPSNIPDEEIERLKDFLDGVESKSRRKAADKSE